MFMQFLKCERGATSVEYGLIASILSLAVILGVGLLATEISALWGDNNGAVGNALK